MSDTHGLARRAACAPLVAAFCVSVRFLCWSAAIFPLRRKSALHTGPISGRIFRHPFLILGRPQPAGCLDRQILSFHGARVAHARASLLHGNAAPREVHPAQQWDARRANLRAGQRPRRCSVSRMRLCAEPPFRSLTPAPTSRTHVRRLVLAGFGGSRRVLAAPRGCSRNLAGPPHGSSWVTLGGPSQSPKGRRTTSQVFAAARMSSQVFATPRRTSQGLAGARDGGCLRVLLACWAVVARRPLRRRHRDDAPPRWIEKLLHPPLLLPSSSTLIRPSFLIIFPYHCSFLAPSLLSLTRVTVVEHRAVACVQATSLEALAKRCTAASKFLWRCLPRLAHERSTTATHSVRPCTSHIMQCWHSGVQHAQVRVLRGHATCVRSSALRLWRHHNAGGRWGEDGRSGGEGTRGGGRGEAGDEGG